MTKTIPVSLEQVEAAKALIEIMGGPEHVDPLIRKIAAARMPPALDLNDIEFVVGQTV